MQKVTQLEDGIAKKKGTAQLLPEIEKRFIEYTAENYNVSKEKCQEIIKPFLQSILDASSYGFSWNHSDAYSCIGYICGYLRYYYPLEFLTVAFNIFSDNKEKSASILEYAKKKGILLFIYTNKPHDIAKEVERHCFPEGLFDKLVGIPLGGVTKPDPEAFFKATEEYHLDYSKVMYFGDSTTDIETAHNLGCSGIYSVLWGYNTEEQLKAYPIQPTCYLTKREEIKEVVNGLI